jgi:hypothetical protein
LRSNDALHVPCAATTLGEAAMRVTIFKESVAEIITRCIALQ